ncbi:MAG: DUF2268 domain-containing putative Zn-dependent protease [Bacteroidota bacterium]
MKNLTIVIGIIMITVSCKLDIQQESRIVTSDIDNFWEAYDRITATPDSAEQYQLLQELYLDKGSAGLEGIRWARRYTPQDYINAISDYPLYWQSVREKTMQSKELASQIELGLEQLRSVYPELRPGKVYFEIGVFRTPGTIVEDMVLIGAEMALGDETVNTSELPESMNYVKNYLKTNPAENIVFLNIHEFIHTQQQPHDYVLLYRTINEGIAEWVAEKVSGVASQSPAISFGETNNDRIRAKFEKQLFGGEAAVHDWFFNSDDNEFGMMDLGYYVGYAICDRYYQQASDKGQAIIDMIDLDYSDLNAVAAYVDASGYFSKPVMELKSDFEANIPEVVDIRQFENGSKRVDPETKLITIEFSMAMNPNARGFEFGPLGEDHVLYVQNYFGFSEDRKSVSFEVKLEAGKRYQLELSDKFASENGASIKPYLIDIETSE